jgi:hypothetical protein
MYPCHVPLSLNPTISLNRMLTQTFIPPPPIPANALAAINSPMFRANPHNVDPIPNTR